ncbi:unnamed protein product [Rotaria sp. Silwood2]|nr:unnamed protein product [Rotaria sp. Silwood2]
MTFFNLKKTPVACLGARCFMGVFGAHSDDGSLTFVFQHDNKSGLEIFDRSTNVWHPVEARDNMIVVNFEDVF